MRLSGLEGLGQGACLDPGDLPGDGGVSARGAVRPDVAAPSCGCLHPDESRRGLRSIWRQRVGPIHDDCRRLRLRSEYLLMLARDLELMKPAVYAEPHSRVTEIKKMLTAFHRKLTADG